MPALDEPVKVNGQVELGVPSYIDEQLIAKSIADGLSVKNVHIIEHRITRAVAAGDNYMSDVFRIAVRFTGECEVNDRSITEVPDGTKSVSLVVKSLPDTGKRGTIIDDLQAYEKEVIMFRDVVPKLSVLVGGTFFAARCYHATNVPDRVIVFEDLKALGYANSQRQAGFDFHRCALVMEKIGRFHAASMRLAEQEPELMRTGFHFNLFNPDGGKAEVDMHAIFEKGLETLIGVAKAKWDGFDPTIVAKLERLVPVYVERLRACLEQDVVSDGGFRVLNHGDLWPNNILLRTDANRSVVDDVVFVDLQLSFYSSPGIDLNYVLANCPSYETRSRLDELLDVYYRSFSATLRQLGFRTVPTMEQVRREIRRMEFFSLMAIVTVLPIVLMDQTDEIVPDMESLLDGSTAGDRAREIQYNGVNYQRIVRPMLIEFNQRGLLDV